MLIPVYFNKMIEWKDIIESLSNDLKLKIDYYEDLFSNNSLIDKDIKLDLDYFDPGRKLRGKKGSILI